MQTRAGSMSQQKGSSYNRSLWFTKDSFSPRVSWQILYAKEEK